MYKRDIFEGTKGEGAIMTDCVGLSDAQIADLKERGAIFDDAPGEHTEARVFVPR
ncbi:MAG: hypothetical protein AAFX78_17985 [Cyanobacteria bacterium J06638_20]